jgi:hypothetical protein
MMPISGFDTARYYLENFLVLSPYLPLLGIEVASELGFQAGTDSSLLPRLYKTLNHSKCSRSYPAGSWEKM